MNKAGVFRAIAGVWLFFALVGRSLTGTQALATPRATTAVGGSPTSCQTTRITLHGTLAPTLQCLDGRKKATREQPMSGRGAQAQPLAWQETACYDDDLVLFWNGPFYTYGPQLCINGSGLLNLNQAFSGRNWNDQASAWWTGCRDVGFYSDINRSGYSDYAVGSWDGESSPNGNFPMVPGDNLGNDMLSSVYLHASYGGDNCS